MPDRAVRRPMHTFTCKCCGEPIEAAQLTDIQFAAVDALGAALATFRAAADTQLKIVFSNATTSVERCLALVTLVDRSATDAQHVALAKLIEHAAAKIAAPGIS